MKRYFTWAFHQFHLLFFLPTKFRRETANFRIAQRFLYPMKLLPFTALTALFCNSLVSTAVKALGGSIEWAGAWQGVVLGVVGGGALGVVFGLASGIRSSDVGERARDLAFGLVFGLVFASAMGVVSGLGLSSDPASGLMLGVVFSVVFGMAAGVAFGVELSLTLGLMSGLVVGLILSVPVGMSIDIAYGVAIGATISATFWSSYFRLVTYPIDLALSAATYFVARRHPRSLKQMWRLCPIVWSEVIWLPLPFAGRLLTLLVEHSREEGFRQVAFVAAERPLQRRVAVSALVETALYDLEAQSVSELADVTEKLAWTTDAPVGLPAELTTALPRFDRVAGHAGQYLALQSPYRKSEALDRAVAEMQRLQSGLIAARGNFAPRLLRIANDWSHLLNVERKRSRALAVATREIPNPFVFGNPVAETEHNVFTGRGDVARQIESGILGAVQAPTLLLHGPRRMGKTSLLNQLPRLLGPEFAPAVVDCQRSAVTESLPSLLRYISRALSDGLKRRRVLVDPLPPSILESKTPFGLFDDWLDGVEQAMPQGTRALLCLDEYERLHATLDAGWGERFLDTLRNTLQHRPRVVLMFTGARTFAEMGPAWTDRFISARRVRVGFLTHEEVVPLLTAPIPDFDMTYAPGALEAITGATRGQPFLTQAVAFELVQLLNEQNCKEAVVADVEEAVARAIISGGEYFANVWSDAGVEGQAVLRAITRDEAPPDHPAALAWLREHDVLASDGGFAVPMVERWVKQNAR